MGFEQGFDRAGIETVLQVENDPHAISVLERHWPDTERLTDVRDVQQDRLQGRELGGRGSGATDPSGGTELPEHVDLIYGGFPCQDVSVAGQRRGLAVDALR